MTSFNQPPDSSWFESVSCYNCGASATHPLVTAQDDLTGKPGDFQFVTCDECGLAYQTPRVDIEHIGLYYDDEYIAHRKETNWGILSRFYERGMDKHDREKEKLVRRYKTLSSGARVLDVGCGSGSFLQRLRKRHGVEPTGVDFKNLTHLPFFDGVTFHEGIFYEQDLENDFYDAITMWHFLEHDYDPIRTLETANRVLKDDGRLVIEVPRLDCKSSRLFGNRWPGLQAPQHTVLYTKEMLLNFVEKAGFTVVDYLPYGAFPAYFYLFAGLAFKVRKGKGINFRRAIYPYFLGQLLLSPVLLFERYLNLAMQTVICEKKNANPAAPNSQICSNAALVQ
jgi:2-polyprenyl-3-methyl-5-hydroxy-6-metoxy-1,4-benzoquinol methylase